MAKLEKFVQLGLKKNGRIVKNEQYTIKQFLEKTEVKIMYGLLDFSKFSFFDYLFNLSSVKAKLMEQQRKIVNNIFKEIRDETTNKIIELINADAFGRKRKKR